MKKGFYCWITILFMLLLSCTESSDSKKNVKKGSAGPSEILVQVKEIKPELLTEKIYTTGSVVANEEVELQSEAAGRITYIGFKEGDLVSKGQLLLQINQSDVAAQLRKLDIQIKQAEDDEERQRKLLKMGGVSQEQYELALHNVKTLKADRDYIASQKAKTSVFAPFTGIIGLRNISLGSNITTSTIIAGLQQIDPAKIEFSVPEKYKYRLKDNALINFTVTGSTRQFSGKVYAVDPKIDIATRTVKAKATAPNDDRMLIPGAFAKIELILERNEKAVLVPTEAIVPVMDGEEVYVLKNGKAASVPVKTGVRLEESIEVEEGLATGDSVIITGIPYLRDGSPVKLQKSAKK